MLLVLRILTIIVCIACLICSGYIIIEGAEKPVDTEAIWLGIGVAAYFLADLYLLYRSYRKKHAPTHWTAFILSILPALIIVIIVWIVDKVS